MDFSTILTITITAILSSGIGYSFFAIYQIRKLQSEMKMIVRDMKKESRKQ